MRENASNENELNYRNIIESLLQGLAIIQDGRIVLCNEALCRMNGFSKEETYRLSWEDVFATIHPEDQQRALQAMTEIMAAGKSWPADTLRMLDRQGNVRWVEVLAVRTMYDGKPALQMSYVDVTERKRAEAAHLSLADQALEGFAILQNGRYVFANQALAIGSGYAVAELLRASASDIAAMIHEDDRARVLHARTARQESADVQTIQLFRFLRKDGSVRWVETHAVVINLDGSPATQISYRDVTESKESEEALRESEAKWRSLVDQSIIGVAMIDQAGKLTEWNDSLARITGIPIPEALGQDVRNLQQILGLEPASGWDRMRKFLENERGNEEDHLRAEITREAEINVETRDGVRKILQVKIYPVRLPSVLMFGMLVEDVTARKEIENQFTDAHRKMRNLAGHLLHAREEERRKIAQDIHDQLGQTLAALKMDLHWLSKRLGGDVATQKDKIKAAIKLSEQAISTVQRIASELRPRMLDDLGLAPALDWLGADFARRTKIACKVTMEIPPEIVGGKAATTLYRIVQESLANVERHSRANHAAVRLFVSECVLNLQIEDDGIGITTERAAAPDSYGLIGIRERLEGLGGSLSISGEPGFGTILLARIPLPKEEESA
jgi:PAS domain S-box-containing protein